ncbi:MAG: glycosyl transferase [Acidobacteriota bacterium]|nr:glycosyl transferase [Acidobacteriota bacterium]
MDRPLRILIVRIGAMGDVLHALPAVTALRNQHPDCFLGWAIEPRWRDLLESPTSPAHPSGPRERTPSKPLVDIAIPVPTQHWKKRPLALSTLAELNRTRRTLQELHFDLCIDLQGSIKSAVVGRMAAAKAFFGAAHPREQPAAHFYRHTVPLHAEHVIDQACELLGAATGELLQPASITLPFDSAAQQWCNASLTELLPHGEKFAFLAPTAGWGGKQWPADRFGALAAKLAHAGIRTFVNASSPGDPLALKVVAGSHNAATLIPSSLPQMIALLRRAALVIAGDTGPLHLAAALERPVVALFGPTDPARTGPRNTRAVVLRHPSSQRNHKRLQDTEPGLMQITVEEVAEAALSLLHDAPSSNQPTEPPSTQPSAQPSNQPAEQAKLNP